MPQHSPQPGARRNFRREFAELVELYEPLGDPGPVTPAVRELLEWLGEPSISELDFRGKRLLVWETPTGGDGIVLARSLEEDGALVEQLRQGVAYAGEAQAPAKLIVASTGYAGDAYEWRRDLQLVDFQVMHCDCRWVLWDEPSCLGADDAVLHRHLALLADRRARLAFARWDHGCEWSPELLFEEGELFGSQLVSQPLCEAGLGIRRDQTHRLRLRD